MDHHFQIIGNDAETFDSILNMVIRDEWLDLQKHALNFWYQLASITTEVENCSLACYRDEAPIAVCFAVRSEQKLSYFGQDIMVLFRDDVEGRQNIVSQIILHLLELAKDKHIVEIDFTTSDYSGPSMSEGELAFLNSGAKCTPRYYGLIDLTLPIDALKRDLRKSYKSLINFGKREIQLLAQSGESADIEDFYAYKALHGRVAGRVTRPKASWEAMYSMVQAGYADMLYGYIGDKLVAASYFLSSAGSTLYGSGAYDRTLFDKPLAHWPIFHQIERAKQKGDKIFNLGEVYLHHANNEKEKNICYFKKGFTSRVTLWHRWSFRGNL